MFELEKFLPYRLSLLSQTVSNIIARKYSERFGISMTEWRCLVIIEKHQGVSAKQIGELTRLDKMAISRAVAKLLDKKLIVRKNDTNDGRSSLLYTSKSGKKIYEQILPLALEFERELLGVLNRQEQKSLQILLDKLQARAETIQ